MRDEFSTTLSQMHIDVARNSTDDFNLFHDETNWSQITDNPFGGPIALGFQLTCFIEDCCNKYREQKREAALIDEVGLTFSNYQLSFANAVKPGDSITLTFKPSKFNQEKQQLTNRLLLKSNEGIAILGFKIESKTALFGDQLSDNHLAQLDKLQDRALTDDGRFFYKRKFTTNSNAKNFLTASGVRQAKYFDELNEKIHFPESYCSGLISCALLESASLSEHDFKKNPMVYTSHKLSIDREKIKMLRSDQVLHFLVSSQAEHADKAEPVTNSCFVLNQAKQLLVQGEVTLAPLSMIIGKSANQ